MINDNI